MPDSSPASRSGAARIAGLGLVGLGAAGLVVAAFLEWYTVTVRLPAIATAAGLPSELVAHVNGIGSVSMPAVGGRDLSSYVATDVAWGGWTGIGFAVTTLLLSVVGAFGPLAWQRITGIAGAAVFGAIAVAFGGYAAFVPVGTRTESVQGIPVQVETAASVGPYVVMAAAATTVLGAAVLLLARRSAPAPMAQAAPVEPSLPGVRPAPSAQPGPPLPPSHSAPAPSNRPFPTADSAWARPTTPRPPAPAPGPSAPSPVPGDHDRTAVAPVAQRRPQPDWDRNWPATVPPKPAPARPSEQQTQIVKRPPRPVKVSPRPETEAIPRRDPRFDSPTEPL